ncbi:MAG: HAD hydrolase-like protein [Oscillospiraceae bacterium]|jgi:phosphoglycolate phosphatase|nr:HAD hydrolase-like protein [Oscillospiraceae bacterium]
MKAKYRLALFDLDGTLTDSGPGIKSCVAETLKFMGRPVPPENFLRRFIGPPLWDSFTKLSGMGEKDANDAVRHYRKLYNTSGIYNNSVYKGIPQLLRDLKQAGTALAVATSKPRSMAKTVLDYFSLFPLFSFVSAADESDKGNGKEELILPVLKKTGFPPESAVMIGDTKFDASGAARSGVNFIGVLYGFGTESEMRREGASVFAADSAGLRNLLIDKT